MAAQFYFTLDGNAIDEPNGWDDSKRTIKRSTKYKGLFVEYTNELIFHGTGYDYIKSQFDTNGFCGDILIDITYRKSEFENPELYFQGVLKLQDIKIDVDHYEIQARIEDRTFTSVLTSLGDTEVQFDSVKTIGGLSLTGISRTIKVHRTDNSGTTDDRTGYLVKDAFQYILDYISDKQITFASDFFSSTYAVRSVGAILFTNPAQLIGAGNIVITYKNAFQETIVLTIPRQATAALTLSYIISQFNFNATGTNAEKFYVQDYRYINKATSNGTDTVTLIVDISGYEIVSVTGASTSIAQFPDTSTNMYRLSFMNGNQLRNANTKVPLLSFDTLFKEMDKFFNLGMSLTTTAGVTTLRIEPFEYFIQQTEVISITNVPSLSYYQARGYSYDNITVGDGSDNRGVVGDHTQKGVWIVSDKCIAEKLDLNSVFVSDSDELFLQKSETLDDKDDKIFVMECIEGGSFAETRTTLYENRIYSTTTGTFTYYNAFNAFLTNYNKLINWMFFINGDATKESLILANTKTTKITTYHEFSYPLTYTQHKAILASQNKFIRFNSGTNIATERVGWIDSIEFENKTGMSKLKLISP